ncbi:MAG: DNA-directed RNA polymerase subunit beta [Brevefilum sp.]|nr:DNA-directed RNA polymerase subunit beta [Brevefilum sp.]MDT8382461.1 DNA-directed RNA polymerase subunit beta [Brevefilum sp.]MDW7755194.1 DNA-directed RNA polymerase subunit beta [Brevefilum sp.]
MADLLPVKSYRRIPVGLDLPKLIQVQMDSFERLKREGFHSLFAEVSPIESYNKGMQLYFPTGDDFSKEWDLKYWYEDPKNTIEECLERDLTYASPLYVTVLLKGKEIPEPIKQDLFMGDFPEMTPKGTFIINGTERVVVNQLIRSPGVYFERELDRATGRYLSTAKMIPDRGAWMEFETRKHDYIIIKFNRRRTTPITVFLRALAEVDDGIPLEDSPIKTGSDEELMALFEDVDNNPDRPFIASSINQEPEWDLTDGKTVAQAALIEFFKRLRPGDPPTLENAKDFLEEQLFDYRRYDLERVGRYKLNQKLDQDIPISHRTITKSDIVLLVRRMIEINNGVERGDDIDHLGNRRVKTVGELIQNKLRVGLRRMERVIRERMSIRDQDQVSPTSLVNIRPVVASLREFFGSSQLSQFMEETNPLSELRHKRTLSALGPGGLRRERAGFDVRDVHHTHYGRICPIETPEGPNIGLIGRMAMYATVNEYGFIETPYRKVLKSLKPSDELVGRELREDIKESETDEVIAEKGERITEALAKKLSKLERDRILVTPFVTDDYQYLSADREDKFVIAQANAPLNEHNEFMRRVSCRYHSGFNISNPEEIDYMDVAPQQIVGVSAALIPFLEHDDANRALMGSNMMAQAVPLVRPEIPIVSTGMEAHSAIDSGQLVVAEEDGEVVSVTGRMIKVRESDGNIRIYTLQKYRRSNQSTCIDQRPAVIKGQRVKKGQIIGDSSSSVDGNLALGQNVLIAFVSWEGGNFEDAILISEKLVQEDRYTSVHIEKHEVEARDTKLGPEEITRDIPNVGEETIRNLDEHGIIRIGAEVGPNDILVGKITPKGEKELTPEERLLRAIFGEKSRDVKDTSLRMPHGEKGTVVDVKVFTREENSDLKAGVDMMVRVSVAQRRKVTEGDKMAGRHGNKGVISMVVPVEDMPFLENGRPIEIILNPLSVPGRMNLGQLLEVHLGWAAERLAFRALTPVFDGATEYEIEAELARAWMIDRAWEVTGDKAWDWLKQQEYDPDAIQDDDEVRLLYLEEWLGDRGYDVYDFSANRDYARRVTLKEWLRDEGYDPEKITFFETDEVSLLERDDQDTAAITACLQLWMKSYGYEVDENLGEEELKVKAREVMKEVDRPMPTLGKQKLRDGMTGEYYDHPVTVGLMTVLKLHHLVEDKVHARSTGPYSLVTQQPLGGKAQFGGQRFGEMEVWALEAYGAAYTLQEMLTVKSDDVTGRVSTYEAIVKGEPIEDPGIPAAFKVLVKEMQSLGLAIEAVLENGDINTFGKDEDKARIPNTPTGLISIGRDI